MDTTSGKSLTPSSEEVVEILREVEIGKQDLSSRTERCIPITGGRVVKRGAEVSLSEAYAMEFVRTHTSVPVPRVHSAFVQDNIGYVVMDSIDALSIDQAVMDGEIDAGRLAGVAKELARYCDQLEELGQKSPTYVLGSWPESPYRNVFFHENPPSSTWSNLSSFHRYWQTRLPPYATELKGELETQAGQKAVLTARLCHGDLNASNILVKDGRLVAILDWDTFGWYPNFWETMAIRKGALSFSWLRALAEAFGNETSMEMLYRRVLHEVWRDA